MLSVHCNRTCQADIRYTIMIPLTLILTDVLHAGVKPSASLSDK